MPYTQAIQGVSNSYGYGFSWGGSFAPKQKEVIVIPFKAASYEQAEKNYDQKVRKQEKIEQLKQMGFSDSNLEFMLTLNDWGEIHVNPAKRTVIIGDLKGDRQETVYNSKCEVIKVTNYYGNKKQVEEFKNGYRIFTEYEKNDNGKYVKKYYEKSPENNYRNIIEQHRY